MLKHKRTTMTDTLGIITNVEIFLSQQYANRHVPVVHRRGLVRQVIAWLEVRMLALIEFFGQLK